MEHLLRALDKAIADKDAELDTCKWQIRSLESEMKQLKAINSELNDRLTKAGAE